MKQKILVFIVTCLILIVAFFLNDMIINGTILTGDLYSQYYHLLLKFMEFLKGEGTLFFSFDLGIGNSMYSIFVYYLMSVTNLILKFISYENLYIYILIIIIVKVSLCSVTMYKYLEYNFPLKKNIFFFSIIYALSTYILTNYFQIMWLDNYLLAPLILMGIDKIIKEDKPLLYTITLTLAILNNYYMGYIICFFSVIYYIYKSLIINKANNLKTFVIASFLSGMMTMITNFTALKEIIEFGRINEFELGFSTDFSKIISSLFMGNEMESVVNYTYPKLYIGILCVLLLYAYFLNKKIDKREKIISGLFIVFLIAFMVFKPLNILWHSLSLPVGNNFRYVYLINIFIIYLCFKSFDNIDFLDKKYFLLFIYIFLIFCFIVFVTETNVLYFIVLSFIFAILYSLIFYFPELKKLLFVVFLVEIGLNAFYTYNNYDTLESTSNIIDKEILNIVKKIQEKEENKFYRMDLINLGIKTNDNILYDYHSVTSWLSTLRYSDLKFLENISYNVGTNSYRFKNNDITNSLFGIKYYADTDSNDEVILEYNDINIYKNSNALNLGYIVDEKVKDEMICSSSFDCSEKMLNYMLGNNTDIYNELEITKKDDLVYEYTVENTKDLYLYIETKYYKGIDLKIYLNDELIRIVNDYNLDDVVKLEGVLKNEYNIGDKIEIKLIDENKTTYDTFVKMYNYNYDLYNKDIQMLQDKQLEILEFNDEYIKGSISYGGSLFTSIPYSENWNVYVDGKKVETYQIFDMFLGIDIEEGQHIIEFKYEVKSLKTGLIISIFSILFYMFFHHKKVAKTKKILYNNCR